MGMYILPVFSHGMSGFPCPGHGKPRFRRSTCRWTGRIHDANILWRPTDQQHVLYPHHTDGPVDLCRHHHRRHWHSDQGVGMWLRLCRTGSLSVQQFYQPCLSTWTGARCTPQFPMAGSNSRGSSFGTCCWSDIIAGRSIYRKIYTFWTYFDKLGGFR